MFTVFILSLLLTIALVPVLKRVAFRMNIVDEPNARKVHVQPMPKTGGLSMAIGAFIPLLLWVPRDDFVTGVFMGANVIVLFGLVDDIRSMNFKQKIIPQFFAALCVVFWGGVRIKCIEIYGYEDFILPFPVSVALTLFVIVGVTNAINLSDGLDGLAGGISMLSFVIVAFLAYRCENGVVALMSIAVVAAIAGFLRYNTYPAVLFMGDAGSQLLGFLSVVFVLFITQENTPYSRILSLPLIGFPILDTVSVMVERVKKGVSPFKADKNHFHHRLLGFGFSHAQAVLIIYIIQACFLSIAFIFRFSSGWVHILLFTLLSTLILGVFGFADRKKWQFKRTIQNPKWIEKLKSTKAPIRISFAVVRFGLPLVLVFQCMIPEKIPLYLSVIALCLICLILASGFRGQLHKRNVLRFAIILVIPLILYLAGINPGFWFDTGWFQINNAAFIVLVIFALLTMKLTKRRQGLKITTMDILIFIVVIIFPNLPTFHWQSHGAGTTIAKALVLFFCLDVLMGELRGESKVFETFCIAVLGVVVFRGVFF